MTIVFLLGVSAMGGSDAHGGRGEHPDGPARATAQRAATGKQSPPQGNTTP